MKDKNKELIEVIRHQLKNSEDHAYKPGAWESFKARYEVAPKRKRTIPIWTAAAASLALIAFGTIYMYQNDRFSPINSENNKQVSVEQVHVAEPLNSQDPSMDSSNTNIYSPESGKSNEELFANNSEDIDPFPLNSHSRTMHLKEHKGEVNPTISNNEYNVAVVPSKLIVMTQKANVTHDSPAVRKKLPRSFFPKEESDVSISTNNDFIESLQVDRSYAYTSDVDPTSAKKKVQASKNLKIGAFVSPSATEQSFDLGGGMVLAYQLSDKIAVRTGASFNQYEVGIEGSSSRTSANVQNSAPVSAAGASLVSENVAYRSNNVMMPNLNSVSSKMQTVDVPLEIKYDIAKNYYVVGGASYAFVISQERYNHYSEYTDATITYSSASNSDRPTSTPQNTIERKIKSNEETIDTDGFGGFVNFSIGKKTGLTKNLNISVEPFVKIPVGSFKQSDMNYTNGGVRIITSF